MSQDEVWEESWMSLHKELILERIQLDYNDTLSKTVSNFQLVAEDVA